ncbi:agamous-like MADS-box protein AGL82 [Rhodamnia argentea]|uniref:Agamous-like MADS-box protein AGL82 n=1 Tax=Rhodamnia argentea TaxID=178133 RepID=A0A8B8PAT8_9MYRT|nr:agamous-like MADS-box protein AGL82 [Rhodamnia argentea]
MGRGKLALELIPKEKARRITYEKRKKGLMKKAQEFTTLCGVDTCMLIYGPAGATATAEPEVWPSSPEKVKLVIERYRSEGADRRAKRTIGLPEFFTNRKRKVDAELAKARLANWEAKYPVSEALIEGFSEEELRRLLGSLGRKLEAAKARLAAMKEDAMRRSSSHVYEHQIHAHDHVYHHHHMQGMFQDVPIPMKQPSIDVKPHLDWPYLMQQQQQQPLFEPDCLNSSFPMPSEWWAQKIQYRNHCLVGDVPPGPSGCGGTALVNNFHHSVSFPAMQNYQITTLEGMMLSETSTYGPIVGNVSLGGTSSSAACYDTQLVQLAPPPGPLSVMQGGPIPNQMKQASSQGNHQFHDYH